MVSLAASPIPVLVIIGLYVACYALMVGTSEADTETYGLTTSPDIEAPEGGLFDSIGNVFETIGGVFAMILGALVFNVPDVPFFIQIPIAIAIIGSLTWPLVTLVRGN